MLTDVELKPFDPLHKSNITYTEQSIFWYLNYY